MYTLNEINETVSPIPPLSFLPPNQSFEVTDPTPNLKILSA